ncbi:MAG: PDZ domain-containing protein [Oscillibacter sp.]|nr:PDZ domain-containing protein [Oscillibacter sp.]
MTLLLCGTCASAADGAQTLIPVGHTVGVKLFARGVMVVKAPESGTPARECGLRSGDVIVSCGGEAVTSTEQFQELLQENGTSETPLEVRRSGVPVTLSVEPERNEAGTCCIGAWIRDSMAGIGTMTYYDPASGTFGALGHGITDTDTQLLMPFASGTVLPSSVRAVKRGERGSAGELRGDFDLTRELGTLRANTSGGIFGTMDPADVPTDAQALPLAKATQGKALVRSNVGGDRVEDYAIEIVRVNDRAQDGRELTLRVTDPALIEATGGIVQGMSGSPIIQNGCLVGAVTHVLLSDPTGGYGISIDSMLRAARPA